MTWDVTVGRHVIMVLRLLLWDVAKGTAFCEVMEEKAYC